MSDQTEAVAADGLASDLARYEQLMGVVRNRLTSRQFNSDIPVPRAHIEMVMEAARHAPSGANAQPWRYIAVTEPAVKKKVADYFVEEQRRRAKQIVGCVSASARNATCHGCPRWVTALRA